MLFRFDRAIKKYILCIHMMTIVRKWGNSLGLRIPRAVAEGAGIFEGRAVSITRHKEGFSVQPVVTPVISLDVLLRNITPQNRHIEIDWGVPKGKEIW